MWTSKSSTPAFPCVGLFFAFSLVCTSCVSVDVPPPEQVVVERSELGRPAWVDSLEKVEPSSEKWFVFAKRELVKLDLGIRQTQANAVSQHCKLIAERMRLEIRTAFEELLARAPNEKNEAALATEKSPVDAAKQNEDAAAARTEAVEKSIAELAASRDCPELEPKDVYWEAVRRQTPEGPRTSYDVHVLLRLKQIHFDEVLAMMANSLKLSGRADLEPLAEVLRGRMSQSPERGTNE